jgi:hypothetical protein
MFLESKMSLEKVNEAFEYDSPVKKVSKTNMFDTPIQEINDKSFEIVSADDNNLGDSFVLEMGDDELDSKVDIYIRLKKVKEVCASFNPIQFKLFEMYKTCIEK